ncbi:MAG: sugar phosphate nucleotidyltransferase [Ignavibacteria bacterium]|jgi:glucose-1-phosphate thymidylyltransferase
MKAIIPAAGVGIRLRPHTYSIPKILLNVAGKPMIAHLTDELVNVKEIDTIIIIVGHLGDKVQDFINDRYASNKNVKFKFVEQKEMNGLGHAVYQAKEFLKNEPVVIILGDTIFEFKMDDFFHLENSAIGVKDVDDPQRFGVIETRNGFISKMVEKPSGPEVTPSKKAIAGLYLIKNSDRLFRSLEYIMEHNIRTQNEFQLTDALQNMIENGEKMIPFEIQNWFDCGKPETLLSTNEYLLKKNFSKQKYPEYSTALIIPPVFIGENCDIKNSIIGPYSTIGNNTSIKDTVVEHSIVGDNSQIENTILHHSIIGSEAIVKGSYRQMYIGDSTEITF